MLQKSCVQIKSLKKGLCKESSSFLKRAAGRSSGFTLVELMVVASVIAMLSVISIPQYRRFQNRARRAEAKSMLSAIFAAEQGFMAEWNGYSTHFKAIGFAPLGTLRYNVGFKVLSQPDPNYCPPAYVYRRGGNGTTCPASDGTAITTYNEANNGSCNWQSTTNVPGYNCVMVSGPDGLAPPAYSHNHWLPGVGPVSAIAFEAGAAMGGLLSGSTSNDVWTLNNEKELRHIYDGEL